MKIKLTFEVKRSKKYVNSDEIDVESDTEVESDDLGVKVGFQPNK